MITKDLMKTFNYVAFAAALLISSPLTRAELVWAKKEIQVKASPEDTEIVARYPFKNEGSQPVKFKSLKTGCSCVTATSSTMEVPPGGTGEVIVKFTPEFRLGSQKRPIAVQFDDEKQTRMALYLQVEIPEIIRPEPLFMRWAPEDPLDAKSVKIVADEKYTIESVKLLPVNPSWDAKVTPVENTRDYTLQIQPKRRQTPQAQFVEVEAKLTGGLVKRTRVYVVVR